MVLKCYTHASKFGKLSSGHRTGKGQFSLHSQRQCRRMFKLPSNCTLFTCYQDYAQNPSSQASVVHESRTSRCTNWILKRQGNQRPNCNIHWITEKSKGIRKKICFIDYTKTFDCVDQKKMWNILNEMAIPDHITCLLRNLNA